MSTNIIRVLSPVTAVDEKLFKKDKKKNGIVLIMDVAERIF